jgi:hypothetical protein
VGGKEVALRLTGFVYQIIFMEYNMTQRGKDRGSWPDLKRQSDAIVQAFAKFMCAASVKSGGAQRDHFIGGFDTGRICADVKSCCEYASQQKKSSIRRRGECGARDQSLGGAFVRK